MATQTLSQNSANHPLVAQLGHFFAALARAFALSKNAEARFDEIRSLQALSDAELARRGIARENIVRHVYADLLND
ncbi:hypothetical protein [Roseicyclus marinus]|uniref:hypothetical protein n=1 Tax=Roseicyclus marinus TaxID=2161673 RepID=UPI00240FC65E|nr:hypothetical protein [Roseicyclus marinus]MDG3040693.1 hypothetical protein [Roseicyclus marinus]